MFDEEEVEHSAEAVVSTCHIVSTDLVLQQRCCSVPALEACRILACSTISSQCDLFLVVATPSRRMAVYRIRTMYGVEAAACALLEMRPEEDRDSHMLDSESIPRASIGR